MARRAASQGSEMTTQRAPYITRRWTETEVHRTKFYTPEDGHERVSPQAMC